MEIAAAGGHNIILIGPQVLENYACQAVTQYFTTMTLREALETTKTTVWQEN
jgi:predicted ATPase with chaperone activity